MNEVKQKLDLSKVKDIVFEDIDKLLKALEVPSWDTRHQNIFMPCPIHGGDNPNGLSMSLERKNWRCWTHNCHEEFGSDIFGFIKGCNEEGTTFSDALKLVCNLYNVGSCQQNSTEPYHPKVEKTELQEIVEIWKEKEKSPTDYTRNVTTINNSLYFENRGFLSSTLSIFGVKDCVDKFSPMFNRAITPVMFKDLEIAHIGRSTKDYVQPKYLFSNGFKKTDYLYNYDRALESSKDKHALFLVEGQGDVWRLYEAGVKNAVGLFGKDISEQQIKLLVEAGVTYIVVLTDNDQAGREGRMKIQRELSRMFNLVYPPMLKKDIGDMSVEQIQEHILPKVEGLY
jgi:5S rRNA maturation endonuclease (ribonuclease M5)